MNPRIRDIMTRRLVVLRPEMDVMAALAILLQHDHSGAPVIAGDGALVGMLSQKDCLRPAIQASAHQEWGRPVSHHMRRDVATLDAGLELLQAAERFLESPYRRFPVTENGRLVGLVSRSDLLAALVRHWQVPDREAKRVAGTCNGVDGAS